MTERLKSRFDDHLSRKLFHLFSGSLVAYLFVSTFSRLESFALVFIALLIALPLEIGRLYWPRLNQWVLLVFGPLMRQEERHKPSAQLYYILGLACAGILFSRPIAIQAILTLAWLDPIAGLFGVRFGNFTWKRTLRRFFPYIESLPEHVGAKTVEGSAAGFCAALLAGVVAWTGPWAAIPLQDGLLWPSPLHVGLFSLVGAFTATLAEAWPSQWDDNANIPFWTGLTVWIATLLIGFPLSFQ